jgi:ElaB/YqjD/DUF883 family membrane-anchored ribosome-binding protein
MSTDKLMHHLGTLVTDAQDLLEATATQTGDRVEQVRARAEESLSLARASLHRAGRQLNDQVHERPWTAAGVAIGIGLVLGILLGRK